MSELSEIDKSLLEIVKRKIEERAGLSGAELLNQKDFDFLLYFIQEHTGEVLSMTTIKRIWKNDFQRLPHLSTLDILCQLSDNKDWHTLKNEYIGSNSGFRVLNSMPETPTSPAKESTNIRRRLTMKLIVATGLFLLAGSGLYYLTSLTPIDTTGIEFSATPTVDLQIPNSVVFTYDVKGYRAKHFYIQQSWDPARKVEVSAGNTKQTDIYYEPGYHYAKLMGDDRVLKEIPVHIQYNDWFVRIRYPDSRLIKVSDEALLKGDRMGITEDYSKQLLEEKTFQLGYMLSRDFNFSADAIQLEASIRFDSLNVDPCPTLNVLIKGTGGYSWITLGAKGCESNFGFIFGEAHVSGKNNDLTSMAMEPYLWQQIGVSAKNGTYQLMVNDKIAYEGSYSRKLGELKEVDFFFNGIGSVDNIHISDGQANAPVSKNLN